MGRVAGCTPTGDLLGVIADRVGSEISPPLGQRDQAVSDDARELSQTMPQE
jgi:hypothetical protein